MMDTGYPHDLRRCILLSLACVAAGDHGDPTGDAPPDFTAQPIICGFEPDVRTRKP